MPVVDIHAHILTEELLASLREAGMSVMPKLEPADGGMVRLVFEKGVRFGPIPADLIDVDARLAEMDRMGVDVQILAAVPMLFGHGEPADVGIAVSRLTNDDLIRVAGRHPDHFRVLASLPMQDAGASIEEVGRLADQPLVRGVHIAPHVAGANLDLPELSPLWEELERRDLPVLIHPCPPIAGGERLKNYHLGNLIGNPMESTIAIASLIFGGVLEARPRLRFGFVHGGGYSPYQIGRWDHGWGQRTEPRVNIGSTPPSSYYRRLFFDSLTHDADSLRFLGSRVGWDHVMVGTDFPFDMADRDPLSSVRVLGLSAEDERNVLEGTVETFLGSRGVL